jgi:nucleotide-binding universal stress UspA family protein
MRLALVVVNMYRILVPVDRDTMRAETQVATIDSLPSIEADLEVHVLHVYEEISVPADEAGETPIENVNESLEEFRDLPDSVHVVIDAFEAKGLDTTVHELVGDPTDAILTTADSIGADVIVMGVRDRRPIGKVVLGSVSQQVIYRSEVPVLVARREEVSTE